MEVETGSPIDELLKQIDAEEESIIGELSRYPASQEEFLALPISARFFLARKAMMSHAIDLAPVEGPTSSKIGPFTSTVDVGTPNRQLEAEITAPDYFDERLLINITFKAKNSSGNITSGLIGPFTIFHGSKDRFGNTMFLHEETDDLGPICEDSIAKDDRHAAVVEAMDNAAWALMEERRNTYRGLAQAAIEGSTKPDQGDQFNKPPYI